MKDNKLLKSYLIQREFVTKIQGKTSEAGVRHLHSYMNHRLDLPTGTSADCILN